MLLLKDFLELIGTLNLTGNEQIVMNLFDADEKAFELYAKPCFRVNQIDGKIHFFADYSASIEEPDDYAGSVANIPLQLNRKFPYVYDKCADYLDLSLEVDRVTKEIKQRHPNYDERYDNIRLT